MNMQMYSAGPMGFPSQRMSMPQGMLQPPSYQSMFGQTSKQITGQQNKGPQMQQSKGQGKLQRRYSVLASWSIFMFFVKNQNNPMLYIEF